MSPFDETSPFEDGAGAAAGASDEASSAYRATLLIGYGAFGLDVLRRLLASTAPRGVLRWEEPASGSPGERSLRDLALLWVPDRWNLKGQEVDAESSREGSSFAMLRDLYRQIEEVPQRTTPEDDLAAAMEAAMDRLLSASSRSQHADASPLGLDVVVLAHPTGPEVVGILDRMLAVGLRRLANRTNLQRAVRGSEALSFVEVLDFENYWDRSEKSRRIRAAVYNSVLRWQKAWDAGEPAFGRFYLVDGQTRDGMRDVRHRIDEISLFLEFLLFEGQRGHLQEIYQPPGGAHQSPVATFGIRMMERSAGLLSRLAAGRFSIGWLGYMSGQDAAQLDAKPQVLRERLAPYRPQELARYLGDAEMRAQLDAELQGLEKAMLDLEPEDPDWPWRLRRLYESTVESLQARLAATATAQMVTISQEKLSRVGEDIRGAVGEDLRHDRRPVPLGTLLAEVESALGELEEAPPPPPVPPAPDPVFRDLEQRHGDYLRFNEERLDPEGNRHWWLLFALVLTAGLVFPVVDLLESVPEPDPLDFLLVKARQALGWITNPLGVAPLLFLAFWGVGRLGLQPRLASRVERGRRFYKDPDRGRFVHHLRSALGPGGALRLPCEHFLAGLVATNALSVRGEVSRELGRIADHLRERHREMEWLRRQMREFLTMHGLRFDGGNHELTRLEKDGTGIRFSVEQTEDFEKMLAVNPPAPERYRSTQAGHNPFAQWDRLYSPAFLHPVELIDRLSAIYKDPFLKELARAGTGPEQERRARELLEFLRRHGRFDLAFGWQQQDGLPTDRHLCLLPARWRALPGVLRELADLRMPEESVHTGMDVARAYLLRLQFGVDPGCLREGSP